MHRQSLLKCSLIGGSQNVVCQHENAFLVLGSNRAWMATAIASQLYHDHVMKVMTLYVSQRN